MSDPYPVMDWFPMIFHGDDEADVNQHIVSEIIFHPAELITELELERMTEAGERHSWEAVNEQLDILDEADIITRLNKDGYTFYGLTHPAKQFIVDSQMYRGHEVMKQVYHHMEKESDAFEQAYRTERPEHPPATDEYEERATDSEAWQHAREQTFRELTMTVEHVGDNQFVATLTDEEDNVLSERFLSYDSVNWDYTHEYREMTYRERRGAAKDADSYGIIIEEDGGGVDVKLAKDGEQWYDIVKRCIHIFLERDDAEKW